jgi:23S rRNA (uridine2552-2'-O)-methyltransferase
VAYQRKDGWYRKAKQEGFRSRAAYKLLELHQKHKLFSAGMYVIDLGCAPGGWIQVASGEIGDRGRVVGIDRLEVTPLQLPQATILLGDITDEDTAARLLDELGRPADLVLSDMAPDTSGVGFADHVRSVELVRVAAGLAEKLLKPGGSMLAKVFEGADLKPLVDDLKKSFSKVQRERPKSTRKGSRELYLLARNFQPE